MFHLHSHNLVFTVHACSDAHLMLSYEPNVRTKNALEIVIGRLGNTITEIRQGQQGFVLVQATTHNILSCDGVR